jgi:hypothetical protein
VGEYLHAGLCSGKGFENDGKTRPCRRATPLRAHEEDQRVVSRRVPPGQGHNGQIERVPAATTAATIGYSAWNGLMLCERTFQNSNLSYVILSKM